MPITEKIHGTNHGKIHYFVCCIDPKLPWLVFLPGLTADHHLFDKQIEELGLRFNCLVWDAPAHGASRPFALKFSMDDLAQYLHDILQAEEIRKPVLIGQSLGGYLSQVYMEHYPNTVSGFISIDSCSMQRKYYTSAELWLLKHTKGMYLSIPWKLLIKWGSLGNAQTLYGRNLMRQTMESYDKGEYCALADHGFRILAEAVEANRPYHISCPVLLICGEKDNAGSARRYNRNWNQQTHYPLVWVPAAGHNSNTDDPSFVNDRIEAFVSALFSA